jgi:exonuclease SbcD
MKIAIVADSHFDEARRFDECIRIHSWIAADIMERGVDLVLHSGDIFEAKSTPTERRAVADWLTQVASHCPVVIVRGNHDHLGDLPLFSRLRTKHPIIVEERAGVHIVAGVAVACLAWPRKAELLARGVDAGQALRDVIQGLGAEMVQHDGPRVLLSHAMVRGSMTSTGQPLVGADMELGIEDLALARAHFVALGHIHKGQSWRHEDVEIVYPGSPRRTAFGEVETKHYTVAEFIYHDGDLTCEDAPGLRWWCDDVEFVETPATPMLLLEAEWDGSQLIGNHRLQNVTGAECRLRYSVSADQRDAAAHWARESKERLLAAGALSVKLEEVVRATTRAKAPEVGEAVTLKDKLTAFWFSKGTTPEAPRKARLFDRLSTLEGAVQ